jgi:hypothetical protein
MNILVLGASYGLLVASILLEKGFKCTIVCNEDEDEKLKKNGFVLNIADKNLFYSPQIFFENKVLSSTPRNFDYNKKYDLCFLTIQEGQLGQNEILKLMEFIGSSKIPLISLMNIPPLSFVHKTTKSIDTIFSKAYNFPDIWKEFDQNYVTHASSDPQVYKKLDTKLITIVVRHLADFKVSNFSLVNEVDTLKIITSSFLKKSDPVKFKVNNSNFFSLSKWSMLLTGNYRCFNKNGKIISIRDAVRNDENKSSKIYNSINQLLSKMGASRADLVPFYMYLKASLFLDAPSSFARALSNGVKNLERTDKLLSIISNFYDENNLYIDEIVQFNNKLKDIKN